MKRDINKQSRTRRHICARRLLALSLALIVGVTFMPLLGSGVSAAEEPGTASGNDYVARDATEFAFSEVGNANGNGMTEDPENTTVRDMKDIVLQQIDGDDLEIEDWNIVPYSDAPAIPAADDSIGAALDAGANAGADASGSLDVAALNQQLGLTATDEVIAQEATSPIQTPTIDTKTGIVTIKTANAGDTITKIYVDNAQVQKAEGLGTQKVTYDTKAYSVGFHTLKVTLSSGTTVTNPDPVPTMIYGVPEHSKKMYELYHNYSYFSTGSTTYDRDASCGMYLAYRIKKAETYSTNGPLDANSDYSISNLTPNKIYEFTAFFGKSVTYQGQKVDIIGPMNGYASTLYMKTGLNSLPIKSVKVKAVNIKKHTHIIPGYVVRKAGKETWYTYRLKVTVKMKKKPGIKGLYINGKKAKGNKKTYSVKYGKYNSIYTGIWVVKPYRKYYKHTIAKIPRKTKHEVVLYSYRDNTYKGYSPLQTRNPKIH